jgi:hypothetical protein
MSTSHWPNATHRFFYFDPEEHSPTYFDSEAERDTAMQGAIDAYLDSGCDGWSEEVTNVVAGVITHVTKKCDVEHKPERCEVHEDQEAEDCDACGASQEWTHPEFDYICNYKPVPLDEAQKEAA